MGCSVRLCHILSDKWPEPDTTKYRIAYIKSPRKNDYLGEYSVPVHFCQTDVPYKQFEVSVPWECISDLWIGREFIAGVPSLPRIDSSIRVFSEYEISEVYVDLFENLGVSYGLPPDEYGVSFMVRGQRYIVSCLDIVRCIFSYSGIIAKQLLHAEGLESLINLEEWYETMSKGVVDARSEKQVIRDSLYKIPFTRAVYSRLVEICGSSVLLVASKKVLQNYRKNKRIQIGLPIVEGGRYYASNIFRLGKTNFIGRLCLSIPRSILREQISSNEIVLHSKNELCINLSRRDIYNESRLMYHKNDGLVRYDYSLISEYNHYSSFYVEAFYTPLRKDCLIPYEITDVIRKEVDAMLNNQTIT